jgi:hypothetical protein
MMLKHCTGTSSPYSKQRCCIVLSSQPAPLPECLFNTPWHAITTADIWHGHHIHCEPRCLASPSSLLTMKRILLHLSQLSLLHLSMQ